MISLYSSRRSVQINNSTEIQVRESDLACKTTMDRRPRMTNENLHNDDLVLLDNLEIEPLSDDDLEAVAGGGCSLWCCSVIIIEP
jgi:hypothetical protein